jgi:hypothetical protein
MCNMRGIESGRCIGRVVRVHRHIRSKQLVTDVILYQGIYSWKLSLQMRYQNEEVSQLLRDRHRRRRALHSRDQLPKQAIN